jgi:predicted metal-dependent HD superfamily phosphohydrolase
LNFDDLKIFILNKLKNELEASLHYHNVGHTIHVLDQCNALSAELGIKGERLILLCTAALLHDVGYIWTRVQHEQRSVEFAKSELPNWGYNSEQIGQISNMILATRIPQFAQTELERIICDADLSYLGTSDFFAKGDDLFYEFLEASIVKTKDDWNKMQVSFLKAHTYHTQIAKDKFEATKQLHLKQLVEAIS